MKKLCLLISLPLLLLISSQSAFSLNLNDSLLAYWSFDDSTANDFSGHGYHGIMMNNPTPVPGIRGTAMRFQGYGENTSLGGHILLPSIDFASMSEFSISMWVYEEDMSFWHGGAYIFFGDCTNGWLGIWNHFGNTYSDPDLKTCFTVGDRYNDNLIRVRFDYTNRNRWMHYCMVYNNGTVSGYINGVLVGTANQNVIISGTNAALARCWWYNGSETATRFTGSMDDVRLYNRALTENEVRLLFNPNIYIFSPPRKIDALATMASKHLTLKYKLEEPADVEIKIYDMLGHEISVLANERQPAGEHTSNWNGNGNNSDMYIYTVKVNDNTTVGKFILE